MFLLNNSLKVIDRLNTLFILVPFEFISIPGIILFEFTSIFWLLIFVLIFKLDILLFPIMFCSLFFPSIIPEIVLVFLPGTITLARFKNISSSTSLPNKSFKVRALYVFSNLNSFPSPIILFIPFLKFILIFLSLFISLFWMFGLMTFVFEFLMFPLIIGVFRFISIFLLS